jgi:hypothetical protein
VAEKLGFEVERIQSAFPDWCVANAAANARSTGRELFSIHAGWITTVCLA